MDKPAETANKFEVSCPECGEMCVVGLNLERAQDVDFIRELMNVKAYSFGGETGCKNGHRVMVAMTVTGG
jgi:hypothetical protein